MPGVITYMREGITTAAAVKVPCKAATTVNITLSGTQTIDGVACAVNDRVLVKNQTNPVGNGIYIVNTSAWQRAPDFDGSLDVVQGTLIPVNNGSTQSDTIWRVTTSNPVVIGTSSITFEQAVFSDAQSVSFNQAGTGAVQRTVQDKLRDVVSVKDFGAVGDGVTSDQTKVIAAVAAAYAAGDWLYWPDGTYLTTASIPNFHSVKHFGPGVVKRGTDLFYVSPSDSNANILYVATTGSASNDGLSSSQPISIVQGAFDALKNYGPVLSGTWTVQLTAGTYNSKSVLVGLRSKNRINIKGPSVGGHPNVPTAIIDGSGLTDTVGMYLQSGIYADLHDIKFQNWSYVIDGYGLVADGQCDISLTNVHAYNCYYAGLSFDNLSQVRMQGGIVSYCTFYGVRLYSQVTGSIGYSGAGVGSSTIIHNCGTGIIARVSCRAHVDYCDINNNDNGIFTEKNSRTVANYTAFTSNVVAVRTVENSVYGESGGGTNTFSLNTKNYVSYGSHDDVSTYQVYWDRTDGKWLYGASAYRTPTAKFEWQTGVTASGASYNTNCGAVFDFIGAGLNLVGLGAPVTGSAGLLVTTVGKPSQGAWYYNLSNDTWQLWINNQAVLYRFNSVKFGPDQDNSNNLGESSFRWSNTYSVNLRPGNGTPIWTSGAGSPEGVVTAAVGSLYTRTDGGASTTLYVKESGAGNTGWVAK